jgi:hypothetical protein
MTGPINCPSTWMSDTRLSDLELLERQLLKLNTNQSLPVEATLIANVVRDIRTLRDAADYIKKLEAQIDDLTDA